MEINFRPSPKQYELWRTITEKDYSPATLVLAGGAAGGGKSYLMSVWLITMCLKYENIRAVVARHTLKALKESTLNTILDLLKEWKISHNFNQKDGFIEFENGSRIILKELATLPSDPTFSRFGSSEYTIAACDESDLVDEKAIEVLSSRLRWKNAEYGIKPVLLMTCNPSTGWLKDRFVKDKDGNPPTLAEHEAYCPFSVFDNPNKQFRDNYLQQLQRLKNPVDRERLLYGNWDFVDANDAVFYSGFEGSRNLKYDLFKKKYDKTKALYLSFDFNIFPYLSCIASQAFPEEKVIRIFTEITGTPENKTNRTIKTAELAGDMFTNHEGLIFVTGDPSGIREDTRSEQGSNDFSQIMRGLRNKNKPSRLKLISKAPSVSLRGEWLNTILEGNDPDGWTIEIDLNNCRNLINDFTYGLSAEDGGKDKKKVTDPKTGARYEKHHHMSDAFDYLILAIRKKSYYVHKRGARSSSSARPFYSSSTGVSKKHRW